jgi:hypothetical protein
MKLNIKNNVLYFNVLLHLYDPPFPDCPVDWLTYDFELERLLGIPIGIKFAGEPASCSLEQLKCLDAYEYDADDGFYQTLVL